MHAHTHTRTHTHARTHTRARAHTHLQELGLFVCLPHPVADEHLVRVIVTVPITATCRWWRSCLHRVCENGRVCPGHGLNAASMAGHPCKAHIHVQCAPSACVSTVSVASDNPRWTVQALTVTPYLAWLSLLGPNRGFPCDCRRFLRWNRSRVLYAGSATHIGCTERP